MILDLLEGKFGRLRQGLMIALVSLATMGLFFLIFGLYAYRTDQTRSIWVAAAIWCNGILFVGGLLTLFWYRKPKINDPERKRSATAKSFLPPLGKEYEYAPADPPGFQENADRFWYFSERPIPLDKILQNLDLYTYQNLYEQKLKYEEQGNQAAANYLLNPMKAWTKHHDWKTHKSELRHVRKCDLALWQPQPSPTEAENAESR